MRILAGLALAALTACSSPEEPVAEPDPEEAVPLALPEPVGDAELEAPRFLNSLTDPRQSGRYAPRDECGGLEGASRFRTDLAAAVLAKDPDALAKLAHPEIKLDFGSGEGIEELRARLVNPAWELWSALETVLPLGCAANSRDGMTIPWYFAQDIPGGDPYMLLIVRGEDVPLLARPDAGSEALAQLSWEAVEMVPDANGEAGPFANVRAPGGQQGYIAWSSLRSLIDYRLIVAHGEDGWQITAFVAGD